MEVFRMVARVRRAGFASSLTASLILLGALAPGCGSDGIVMGKVSGKVTYQGKPLTTGTVTFIATNSKNPNATSPIGPDGSYNLQTTEPGDGAAVGDYKVAVTDIDSNALNTALPGAPTTAPKSALPKQYQDANTSGITVKVESGSKTFDIELK